MKKAHTVHLFLNPAKPSTQEQHRKEPGARCNRAVFLPWLRRALSGPAVASLPERNPTETRHHLAGVQPAPVQVSCPGAVCQRAPRSLLYDLTVRTSETTWEREPDRNLWVSLKVTYLWNPLCATEYWDPGVSQGAQRQSIYTAPQVTLFHVPRMSFPKAEAVRETAAPRLSSVTSGDSPALRRPV